MTIELYKGFGWINDTGSDIEPGSALEIKDSVVQENEIFFKIKKPTTSGINKRLIYFNGPVLVKNNDAGRLQVGPMFIAAKISSAIALGDTVGPVNSEWYVSKAGTGFVFLGTDSTGVFPNAGIIASIGGSDSLFRFTLNADWGATDTAADAAILEVNGTSVVSSTSTLLKDPTTLFRGGTTSSYGLCIKQAGFYYVVQMSCPYTG